MIYRIYLRSHAPDEQGRVDAKTNTPNPGVAEKAYRALLSREDLIGQPWAAVLSKDGHSIYFSRFDRNLGDGRIHPDAPLNLFRDDDGTREATLWRPAKIDWSAPFGEICRAWRDVKALTNPQAAAELEIPENTWKGWLKGEADKKSNGPVLKLMRMLL